jgi:pilus assembly protein CpaB
MSSTLRFAIVAVLLTSTLALGLVIFNLTRPVPQAAVTQASQPLTYAYLAAARVLPAGTLTRDEDFVAKAVPMSEMPPDAIQDTPEARAGLRGALIRNYIDLGRPVTVADVLRPRDRGFIASVLKDGDRAVAIGVDPVSGVAGLIWPGDHVDVLLVQDMGEKEPLAQRALSETVLADIRVIAIDQEMVQGTAPGGGAAGKLAHTVTLEVDPMQAQKVAVATTMGKLSLAIRAAADASQATQLTPTFGADVSAALQRPTGATVTVFNGTEGKEMKFQ